MVVILNTDYGKERNMGRLSCLVFCIAWVVLMIDTAEKEKVTVSNQYFNIVTHF